MMKRNLQFISFFGLGDCAVSRLVSTSVSMSCAFFLWVSHLWCFWRNWSRCYTKRIVCRGEVGGGGWGAGNPLISYTSQKPAKMSKREDKVKPNIKPTSNLSDHSFTRLIPNNHVIKHLQNLKRTIRYFSPSVSPNFTRDKIVNLHVSDTNDSLAFSENVFIEREMRKRGKICEIFLKVNQKYE